MNCTRFLYQGSCMFIDGQFSSICMKYTHGALVKNSLLNNSTLYHAEWYSFVVTFVENVMFWLSIYNFLKERTKLISLFRFLIGSFIYIS